jgi:hypothetical protein
METQKMRRISVVREFGLLLRQGWRVLLGNTLNLTISLLFPFLAAGIAVWIAGKDMYNNFESTKSACFILVCAAIWGGLFNSIQVVVKERKNVKRDYVSGALRIGCYTASRALIQMLLCLFQSLVLSISFYGVDWAYGNKMPEAGILMGATIVEYWITMFLIVMAADALGLMVSSFVKNEQLASQLSPYILIVQLLFSGVLFAMEGASEIVSALMLSRWGMEALGSISDLNELPLRIQEQFPMVTSEASDSFLHTTEHLLVVWLILVAFVVVPLLIGNFALHGVKKDSRG